MGIGMPQYKAPTTYGEFLATHLPTFVEASEPLEADNWLLGAARAWWVNYTTTHPADHV
jgi:hypothetical protein